MKQAKQMEAPQQKRKLCLASLSAGALGFGLAAWALKVDAMNNYELGAQFSHEAAQGMVMAALALAIVPILAALGGGWDRWLRITFWVAVTLTVVSAISAYADKQGKLINATEGEHGRYEQAQLDAAAARKEIAEARAEAATIAETASVADLQAMVDHHGTIAATEAKDRGGRGKFAKAAEEAQAAALARVPAARAKATATDRANQAQIRLDRSQDVTKSGPANQSPLAVAIAAKTGQTPAEAARSIALTVSGLLIALTILSGLLVDQSVKLIAKGLGYGQQEAQEAATGAKQVEPRVTAPKSKVAMLATMSNDERLDHFIKTEASQLLTAKPISSKELYELFSVWWLSRLPGAEAPKQRKLAERMKVADLRSVKVRGVMTYGAELAAA
jgi:hypothetical protein